MILHPGGAAEWPRALRRYIVASAVLHLAWELAQLPLYTLWAEPIGRQAFALVHCLIGDVMIAGLALLAALALVGRVEWPKSGSRPVWLLALVFGAGYTVYSEWLNVNVRGSWTYAPAMPTLPFLGTGIAPLVQWLIVPTAALHVAAGRAPWRRG